MTKNNYNTEKTIDFLYNRGYTNFLSQKELSLVKGKLRKNEYNILELYEDSNKVVLYQKSIPNICLLKIESKVKLRHQDILGTIFSLGIKEDIFGDIIKYEGDFYIFVFPQMLDYFKYNITSIKNNPVILKEESLLVANKFKQEYLKKEYIVSSLRIDNIVSTITNESRNSVLDKFKNKEIILNHEEEIKPTRILHENDIFSIRRYGKYKFSTIKKTTKKGGFIIEILVYI